MSKYRKVAIRTVELCTRGLAKSPQEAWEQSSSELFGRGTSSQKKGCPKDTFLGLCEEGLIKGVQRGHYTRSKKNKKYALDAVAALKQSPSLAANPTNLWYKVMKGEHKVHNHQMDVIISLWDQGLII